MYIQSLRDPAGTRESSEISKPIRNQRNPPMTVKESTRGWCDETLYVLRTLNDPDHFTVSRPIQTRVACASSYARNPRRSQRDSRKSVLAWIYSRELRSTILVFEPRRAPVFSQLRQDLKVQRRACQHVSNFREN